MYYTMLIKILGTGCPKCKLLEQATRDAVAQLWIQAEIIKVENMEDIMTYDIMSTPWLVIDEKVIFSWRVMDTAWLKEIFIKEEYNTTPGSWEANGCCSDKNSCNIGCKPDKDKNNNCNTKNSACCG